MSSEPAALIGHSGDQLGGQVTLCKRWLTHLGIYTTDKNEWANRRTEMVEQYTDFIQFLGLSDWHTLHVPKRKIDFKELPNPKLMNQIHADVVRTGHHIYSLPKAPINSDKVHKSKSIYDYDVHLRRLERILYSIGTTYHTLSYMQGFNELLLPLYYVNLSAKSLFENAFEVECVTFYCLHSLLSNTQLNELYTTQDNSSLLLHQLTKYESVLEAHLPRAYAIIKKHNIHPLLYSFKWFSILFAQEYALKDILVLWDSIFKHFDKLLDYVFLIGIARISFVEKKLDENNLHQTISTLQNIEQHNINEVIDYADSFWKQDHTQPSSNILSSVYKYLVSFITF